MEALRLFKSLNRAQRNTFIACFLGWTLDALDFFLLTFVFAPVAHDFGRTIPQVTFAITITLMMRPLGAFIFGWLGDRFGRRIPLMIDIVFYSIVELLTAFAPNFGRFCCCAPCSGSGWAANGAWVRRSRWNRCQRRRAVCSPEFCNKATPSAISWPRWFTGSFSHFRVARIVCRGRVAGAARYLYSRARPGVAGLGT
jgi:hypothetical protein